MCVFEQRFQCRGAQCDDHMRRDLREFLLEPVAACVDFALRGGFMHAPLTARLPFEMLDGIRYEHGAARDAGFAQSIVEQLSCRADEGLAGAVLAVSGLLADHHDGRVCGARPRDALRRIVPKRAAPAFGEVLGLLIGIRLGAGFGSAGRAVFGGHGKRDAWRDDQQRTCRLRGRATRRRFGASTVRPGIAYAGVVLRMPAIGASATISEQGTGDAHV